MLLMLWAVGQFSATLELAGPKWPQCLQDFRSRQLEDQRLYVP
jgi:hypothetical protein